MVSESLHPHLVRHGRHSLAYSTLQADLHHFTDPEYGYIAWQQSGRYAFVLADPVCSPEKTPTLIERFHQTVDRPAYVHVGDQTARHLAGVGYRCNLMGKESAVDLNRFHPTWRSHSAIRESVRRFSRLDVSVVEASLSDIGRHGFSLDDIRRISRHWLRQQGGRELRFLVRPMNLDGATDVRRFFLIRKNRLVGYTFFDPIYSDGRVVAYCPNISRYDDRSLPTGRSAFVNLIAARQFETEGIKHLLLGLLPLDGDLKSPYPDSTFLRHAFALARRTSIGFNFRGLSRHKQHYKGTTSNVYYASARRGADFLAELRALAGVLNLV